MELSPARLDEHRKGASAVAQRVCNPLNFYKLMSDARHQSAVNVWLEELVVRGAAPSDIQSPPITTGVHLADLVRFSLSAAAIAIADPTHPTAADASVDAFARGIWSFFASILHAAAVRADLTLPQFERAVEAARGAATWESPARGSKHMLDIGRDPLVTTVRLLGAAHRSFLHAAPTPETARFAEFVATSIVARQQARASVVGTTNACRDPIAAFRAYADTPAWHGFFAACAEHFPQTSHLCAHVEASRLAASIIKRRARHREEAL